MIENNYKLKISGAMKREIKVVGCTPVTKDLTVVYYINSLDDSGRDDQWGHTTDRAKARRAFRNAKKNNYDMQLYISLVKDYEGDSPEAIDAEVIDTYWDEEK